MIGRPPGDGEAYIVEDNADKQIQRHSEQVDNCGPHLLWYMLTAHLHHAGPEQADSKFEDTEGNQLQLPLECDACGNAATQ